MTATRNVDIAIIGAGPAGLAAALSARAHGAGVLVIDEYAQPGGQFHRQPSLAQPDAGSGAASPQQRAGRDLAAAVERAGADIWREATVWGAYAGGILAIDRDGTGAEVRARRLVIATGAHDRVMPFPGWTLPGVITAGAAQAMVKAHAVLPGQRVVVAGSGPFLLVVALELARAGARVEVIEAAAPSRSALAAFVRFPRRWGELGALLAALAVHRVPIRTGRAVIRAEGSDELAAVVSARLDGHGAPISGTERRHAVDALAIANGFRAQAEVARVLGCATRYDEALGGRVVIVDADTGRTSVDGVYAAGEITGVAGHQVARAEGTIAGASAAMSVCDAADDTIAATRRKRRDAQAFADLVARTYAPRPGLDLLVTPSTIVCRCEGIPRSAIDEAIDAGAHTTSAVKRWTRCGMGRCQGRFCIWPLARIISRRIGQPLADVDNMAVRLPLKPVALASVVAGVKEINRP